MDLIGTVNAGHTVIAAIPLEYGTDGKPIEFQVAAVDYERGHANSWRAYWQGGMWQFCWGHPYTAGTMQQNRTNALRYMAQKYIDITNP